MAAAERDLLDPTGTRAAQRLPSTIQDYSSAPMRRDLVSPDAPAREPASGASVVRTLAMQSAPSPTPTPASPSTTTTPVLSTPVLSQVQDNETVKGQLRDLLAPGSSYIQQARDESRVYAASRGLQNSTLAGQAGVAAAIDRALPIAGADATTFSNRAQQNVATQNEFGGRQQGFEQTQQLSTQDHLQRLVEQSQAGDINSRLQLEQAGYNSNLSAQENIQRLEQLRAEGDIQGTLALQQFNYATMQASQQQGFALDLGNQQFQNNQKLLVEEYAQRLGLSTAESTQTIERMNVQHRQTLDEIAANAANSRSSDSAAWTRNLQAAYLNAVTQRQMSASQEIQGIYTTQGLTSAQQTQAVSNARARLQTDIDAMAAYFQQTPGWPSAGGGGAVTAPPGTQPPGMPPSSIPRIPALGRNESPYELPIGPEITRGGGGGLNQRGRTLPV